MGVLSRWLGFPAAELANDEEARRHYEAGELLRGRVWKCSLCGPLSLPQFMFLKGKPSGTHLTVACAPGGVRRSVCGQVFQKFSINSCTSGPTFPPHSFQIWCFWVPDLSGGLSGRATSSEARRGEKRRQERREVYFQELAHDYRCWQVQIRPGRPEIGNLQRNVSPG